MFLPPHTGFENLKTDFQNLYIAQLRRLKIKRRSRAT